MRVTNPEAIESALQHMSVDQYRHESSIRKLEREYRWYVNPDGIITVPSGAPAPMIFTEWQRSQEYITTDTIAGTQKKLGSNALISTRGLELPLNTSKNAIHDFYTKYDDRDKRFFGEFLITPNNVFPPIVKPEQHGVIEFDDGTYRHLAVEALGAVLFGTKKVLEGDELEEYVELRHATMERRQEYIGIQRDIVMSQLRNNYGRRGRK